MNIDLLKADDGQIYIIELTGRVGATCLPELVSLYYGINYYEMIVKNALGEDPRQVFDRPRGAGDAKRLPLHHGGQDRRPAGHHQ